MFFEAFLHKIPSGLNDILLYFPINIYSLRACGVKSKTDNSEIVC